MDSAQKEKKAKREEEKRIKEAETREEEKKVNHFRMKTASSFVTGYLIFIGSAMLLSGLSLFVPMNGTVNDVMDIIVTISAIFSGPLGLIIGYFYRAERQK